MKLSAVSAGRDNNFNLIRFLAALAVLFSHSFLLATGTRSAQPLKLSYGVTWGDIAVDVFFVTSGFLVTSSLLTRQKATAFLWGRVLRIYPALLVMLCVTVFAMGTSLTSLPIGAYLTARETWHYFLRNAFLFLGVHFALPGVFTDNPFIGNVNGSLWTLPYEIWLYALLLALWLVASARKSLRPLVLCVFVLEVVILSGARYLEQMNFEALDAIPRFMFFFFAGASFYLLREKIPLRKWAFFGMLGAIAISLFWRVAFFFALSLSLPYIIMYSAYAFGGPIRAFNRLGDYSYGIYIYAFAVQQSLADLIHGISLPEMIALSAIASLTLAALSWHILEKRALRLKGPMAAKTQVWLDACLRRLAVAAPFR